MEPPQPPCSKSSDQPGPEPTLHPTSAYPLTDPKGNAYPFFPRVRARPPVEPSNLESSNSNTLPTSEQPGPEPTSISTSAYPLAANLKDNHIHPFFHPRARTRPMNPSNLDDTNLEPSGSDSSLAENSASPDPFLATTVEAHPPAIARPRTRPTPRPPKPLPQVEPTVERSSLKRWLVPNPPVPTPHPPPPDSLRHRGTAPNLDDND